MKKVKNIKKLFGKRLQELRVKKDLSQQELSERIKIGDKSLSKLERGINFVKADTLENLINELEIEPTELFDFLHHRDIEELREELIKALKENDENVQIIYRIFKLFK